MSVDYDYPERPAAANLDSGGQRVQFSHHPRIAAWPLVRWFLELIDEVRDEGVDKVTPSTIRWRESIPGRQAEQIVQLGRIRYGRR